MAPRVFLTGASGFVGAPLLAELVRRGAHVTALSRSASAAPRAAAVEIISGDITAPETYRASLAGCDAVLHLAAATGKASRDEHFRVNAAGTETLIAECARAGVPRFLFVSSIATTFPDLTSYHYAQAKRRAEDALRASTLAYAIVRPTMIFGAASPIQAALTTLALAPVVPVFGAGTAVVQPVHVDDVVAFIAALLDQVVADSCAGETFEVGGPRALTIEELLQTIRVARTGRRGRVLHVPLWPLLPALRAAEAIGLSRVLPLTAGQLATFRFAGTAKDNAIQAARRDTLVSLECMVRGAGADGDRGANGATGATGAAGATAAGATPVAARASHAELASECEVFARHLIGVAAGEYVTRKYIDAHDVARAPLAPAGAFDLWLVRAARRNQVFAAVADSYASVFVKGSLLRRKLVLLLAILETCAPHYRRIDAAVGGGIPVVVLRLAWRGSVALVQLAVGVVTLTPVRMLHALRQPRSR